MKNSSSTQNSNPQKPRNVVIEKEPGRPLDHPAWKTSVIMPGIAQYSNNEDTLKMSTLLPDEMNFVKNLNSTI